MFRSRMRTSAMLAYRHLRTQHYVSVLRHRDKKIQNKLECKKDHIYLPHPPCSLLIHRLSESLSLGVRNVRSKILL